MSYQDIIKEACPHHNPRHIEGMMRVLHPTLDHFTKAELKRLAKKCAPAVDAMTPEGAEAVAQSYGI